MANDQRPIASVSWQHANFSARAAALINRICSFGGHAVRFEKRRACRLGSGGVTCVSRRRGQVVRRQTANLLSSVRFRPAPLKFCKHAKRTQFQRPFSVEVTPVSRSGSIGRAGRRQTAPQSHRSVPLQVSDLQQSLRHPSDDQKSEFSPTPRPANTLT